MYTSHGVPLKASANCRGEDLAVAITQRQRTWCLRRSHNTAIVIDIGGFGNEHSSAPDKLRWNWLRAQPTSTPVETVRNPIGTWSGFFFFVGMSSSNSFLSIFPAYVRELSGRTARWFHGDGASRLQCVPERLCSNIHKIS